MKRIPLLLLVLTLASCASPGTRTPADTPAQGERRAVLLHINDVYRIEGVEDGQVGGLARLRTLRKELEEKYPDLILVHGGDFLFPSFASRMFNGEQMISVMNALDGNTAFDDRMLVVLGNHELEKTKLKDASILDQRIEESQFRWLGSNIVFKKGEDGRSLVEAPNLARTNVLVSGGIRIGFFGVTIPTAGVAYVDEFADPIETARELTAELRAQGAEVVVAMTHLRAEDDRRLLETLGAAGPDLILGGHDHEKMAIEVGRRRILKADADARTATVVRLSVGRDGRINVAHDFRALEHVQVRPDPDVLQLVGDWQAKHEQQFCTQAGSPPGCLGEVYGLTRTLLEAEENKIRGSETSLGDWVADQMLQTMKDCGAQVAFINSGSLRLNTDLPAGTRITRRHVEELFAYPTPLRLIRIDGATLQKVVDNAVQHWPGSGSWLQVAGMAYVHDTAGKAARNLSLLGEGGARSVRPDETILVATNDYLVHPEAGDQDGYTMLDGKKQKVEGCAAEDRDLKEVVEEALRAAGTSAFQGQGIEPKAEGRICQPDDGRPCLAAGASEQRTARRP
ncbi:MAG TPA: 5'-nucleotidase C-terminal domain-containing protein [Thermoanaerobaculia bacterium]|jgi:2',3'-cyclic-nucleotide 2'-phosphodiesterase (5'-nucleotidase family)|nr:5'-nucleotidase C-terminal domain-containing protein [Thermoanaerobaculia bacterium]